MCQFVHDLLFGKSIDMNNAVAKIREENPELYYSVIPEYLITKEISEPIIEGREATVNIKIAACKPTKSITIKNYKIAQDEHKRT